VRNEERGEVIPPCLAPGPPTPPWDPCGNLGVPQLRDPGCPLTAANENTVLSDPSPAVSATTAASGGETDGDVNGDATTDRSDLGALLDYLFVPFPAQRPDVNCDGTADAADVMVLLGLL